MKDTIIIVEGPQGVGKTTFTNELREKIPATDLYRLTGIKDKTNLALTKNVKRYNSLLEYVSNLEDVNIVFDRTFFSEEVYSRLGYKPYSFHSEYEKLLKKLDLLDFDIYFIVLYLEDTNTYKKRLCRDKHQYQKFDIESSIKQQEEYLKIADEVERDTKNIKVIKIAYDEIPNREEMINEKIGFLFNG